MPEKKNLKSIPKFKSEDEERKFWESHDSVDYLNWSQAKRMSSESLDVMSLCGTLKPSIRGVTLKNMEEAIREEGGE